MKATHMYDTVSNRFSLFYTSVNDASFLLHLQFFLPRLENIDAISLSYLGQLKQMVCNPFSKRTYNPWHQ